MIAADRLTVDIIIDNCDYGRFVGAAIDSALAQTHPGVRVTVVDDGSSDDSRSVIAGYAARIDAVLKPNGGQGSAVNAGLARSAGEVVIVLDADDLLMPDTAARVAAAFAGNPDVARVQYPMAVVDERGEPTGALKPLARYRLADGDLRRAALTFPFDLPHMAMSGNAFSRSRLERFLPVPEDDYRLLADWYLVHMTALVGRVVTLEGVGALYRVHGANRHERGRPRLDLNQVRATVMAGAATRRHLQRAGDELGLPRPPGPILSVADLGHRLISLRLEPERHPLPADRAVPLVVAALRASRRRFDIGSRTKLLLIAWFAAMAVAPRRLARRLALLFLFPETRGSGGSVAG